MQRVELVYSMTTDLDSVDDEPGLQHWLVDVRQVDGEEEPPEGQRVGSARVTVVSLECPNPIMRLDEIDQDLSNIGMFFFDVNGPWLKQEFQDSTMDIGNVVIVKRVDLNASVRGNGLGPLVASEIMLTFRRLGCAVSLMEAESASKEQCDKLCSVWEQAGMRRVSPTKPYLIGDLTSPTFDEAYERARDRCTLIA